MKPDGNKKSNAIWQIALAVIVPLVVGGTAPWWWDKYFNTKEDIFKENIIPITDFESLDGEIWHNCTKKQMSVGDQMSLGGCTDVALAYCQKYGGKSVENVSIPKRGEGTYIKFTCVK